MPVCASQNIHEGFTDPPTIINASGAPGQVYHRVVLAARKFQRVPAGTPPRASYPRNPHLGNICDCRGICGIRPGQASPQRTLATRCKASGALVVRYVLLLDDLLSWCTKLCNVCKTWEYLEVEYIGAH